MIENNLGPVSVIELLQNREQGLRRWILHSEPQCLNNQVHLDEGTPERTYWHYGYMMAIRDVIILLTNHRH